MKKITQFEGTFLSNFYPCSLIYKGIKFPTSEHAYQAAKATNAEDRDWVAEAKTPGAAKRRGRSIEVRPDWDQIKDGVMLTILRAKFANNELAEELINTYPAELVEGNTWGDTYWGVCNGVGQNKLGNLLMRIRNELMQRL